MKFKKLGFETKEGLSLANYSDGWSREYGEGGSYHVDVLYHGKKVAEVLEEGNGGPVDVSYEVKDHEAEDNAVLAFLRRVDVDYQPSSKYDFCVNATKASDIEYATFINLLLDEFSKRKDAKKKFDKGYSVVMFIDNGYGYTYIASIKDDEAGLKDYANKKGYSKADTKFSFIRPSDLAVTSL